MSLTDPIGHLLTSVRNASRAKKAQVDVPASRMGSAVVDCLKMEGFIQNWRHLEGSNPQGVLRIYLKYTKDRKPIIQHIHRVSKPGLRIYVTKTKVPKVFSGIGMAILSTPQGILTDAKARAQGIGGEVICRVW